MNQNIYFYLLIDMKEDFGIFLMSNVLFFNLNGRDNHSFFLEFIKQIEIMDFQEQVSIFSYPYKINP
jgi:hypothetical protein